jgi:eukaryotic-like serine/threonine-protein kinase
MTMSGPASSNSATLPTTGDVIDGKYILERLLGQGGMGAVYAARHRKLGHAVAIKVMLADAANHEAASRFVNEGRAAANIQNEHVVRVSDVDEENGYAYMVLELLEGEDLSQVLDRERRLPPNVAVAYMLQALDGVRQAHAQGIVHRDLKPSNLFLAKRQDGTSVIKVLDFGISKANSSNPLGAAPGALTSTKAMLGSPLYMSPEQLRSSKSVDARADIWAMGVILYELITGKLPFMGENLGELFAQILEVEAPLLRVHVPDAPQMLEAIVARCLQRRPEHRYQNVAELERELAPFAAGPAASPFAASAMGSSALAPHTAMMQTPPLAQVHAAQAQAQASGQYGRPPGLAQTPPGMGHMGHGPPPGTYPGPARPGMNTPGSVTGSGAHVPVVKGTAPLGAITPQPNRQTDGAWQSTGSSPKGPSSMLMIVGGLAVLALIGVGFAGYTVSKTRHAGPSGSGVPSAVASADLPPTPPVPTPASATPPTPTAVVSVAAVASSAPANTAGSGPVAPTPPGRRTPPVIVAPVVRQPDPPPVAKVEPPTPPVAPKSTKGNPLQGER